MWDHFLRTVKDIWESYTAIRMVDLAQPTYVALWLIILLWPLMGIDRRDKYCGLMYSVYLAGSGVALVYALPQQYIGSEATLAGQLAGTVSMMVVAAFRWWFGSNPIRGFGKTGSLEKSSESGGK